MYSVVISEQCQHNVNARDRIHARATAIMLHFDANTRDSGLDGDLDVKVYDACDTMVDAACEAYVSPTRTLTISPKHQSAIESAEILMSVCNPETAADLREIISLIQSAS